MNLREVRQAAEYVQSIIAGWEHHPSLAPELNEMVDEWRSKLLMQSTHILATIDPSPDEPITSEWLREEWGAGMPSLLDYEEHATSSINQTVVFDNQHGVFVNSGEYWEYSVCQRSVVLLSTRQQFCDLARALGIPRRKDGAK